MEQIIKKADTLKEIRKSFQSINSQNNIDMNDFFKNIYSNVDKTRSKFTPTKAIIMALEDLHDDCFNSNSNDKNSYKSYLMGHKGCGKTTELQKIKKEIEDKYYIFYDNKLDNYYTSITDYTDFIYYLATTVVERIKNDETLKKHTQKDICSLFETIKNKIFGQEIYEQIFEKEMSVSAEAGINTDTIFSKLAGVFLKISAKANLAEETKKTLTMSIQNTISDFHEALCELVSKVGEVVYNEKQQLLLLIIDGLDKIQDAKVQKDIFVENCVNIYDIPCNIIFTFPISLNYTCSFAQVISGFEHHRLSMIKLHEKEYDKPFEAGIKAMEELISKRMDLSLFEDEKIYKFAIWKSGGLIRDLFHMITDAASNARLRDGQKIEKEDMIESYNKLKSDYIRSYFKIFDEIIEVVYNDEQKNKSLINDENDDKIMNMFSKGILIEYNGEGWHDIHPAIRDYIFSRPENINKRKDEAEYDKL